MVGGWLFVGPFISVDATTQNANKMPGKEKMKNVPLEGKEEKEKMKAQKKEEEKKGEGGEAEEGEGRAPQLRRRDGGADAWLHT